MDKNLSEDIKKLDGGSANKILVRGLILLFTATSFLLIQSKRSELEVKDLEIKNRDVTIELLRRKVIILDSLYQDCGRQRLFDSYKTLDRIERNHEIYDSFKTIVKKLN